ncbi:MAG: FAD/NAD(P)-binding protein [Deltaproteobacteria bacterium]|nr:FAD/NAD(P)-binding protein [Deltaproteobacteria bacterium]
MATDPMLPTPYHVHRVRKETADTVTCELVPAEPHAARPFAAGQFNMIYLFGVGEVPISISGDPTKPSPLVHTVRAVGPVSKAMAQLKRGEVVGVRGPFGSAWPVEEAVGNDVVLVAGGIGLAPLRSALLHLLAHRQRYGRILLLYGARTPPDLLYVRDLEQWRSRFDLDVEVTVDSAATSWSGSVGVVTTFIARASFDPQNTLAMVCGPEVMMRFTIRELHSRGVMNDHIFLSMERNMKCAVGLCGHCQFGPTFLCKDGPVLRYDRIMPWFGRREV